ncbi:MAG: hypothetical protein RL539_1627, partial [Pseudomonadota bacterium]
MDSRQALLKQWLQTIASKHVLDPESLQIASADASFRRYFRVACKAQGQTFIVMDAPPPQED